MTSAITLVVFGASGDMARRLLFPVLHRLECDRALPDLNIVGVGLEDWRADQFRLNVKAGIEEFDSLHSEERWQNFAKRLDYESGDLSDDLVGRLANRIDGPAAFYLALPPGMFGHAARALADAGLNNESSGWRRLVIEKPFGHDVASAHELQDQLERDWAEEQIFRIDHFLGKETVQNLLVFRLANRFLEPLLNAEHVEQVQITVAETLGLEGRYRYYDGIGALRDMLQNHLMQLFTLASIEPPARWDPDLLADHYVEVLKSVRPIRPKDVPNQAVRGVYTAGRVHGEAVSGYLEEEGVPDDSTTETFAALKFWVDNWRWKGVPFYLRSGKRLTADMSEIAIQFRAPPTALFEETPIEQPHRNSLVIRLRPEEALAFTARAKVPGLQLEARDVVLHANYAREGDRNASAYETLLLDVLQGDRTTFLRFDQVDWAWRVIEPVLEAWRTGRPEPYAAGEDGPAAQHDLMEPGTEWRPLTAPLVPHPDDQTSKPPSS